MRKWPPRIIPARAGFTEGGRMVCSASQDHPRSRGVYVKNGGGRPVGQGSSPLARGLHSTHREIWLGAGIIPARAGFTSSLLPGIVLTWDHPRSRGVYHAPSSRASDFAGSSPLARGLLGDVDAEQRPGRIIPARAGFTPPRTRCECALSDHPRSRGVYVWLTFNYIWPPGSSPLARGLQ